MGSSIHYKKCKTCKLSLVCWSFGGPDKFVERFVMCEGCYGTLYCDNGGQYVVMRVPRCKPVKKALCNMSRRPRGWTYVSSSVCPYCQADESDRARFM